MRAFIKFNKAVMKLPVWVQLWLMLLILANMVIPVFFLDRLEAQVILVVFFASATLMIILTGATGFSRLLGLGHILWIPLLYFLWARFDQIPANDFYGMWLRIVMALNVASLVIDTIDVARYISGERDEMVQDI